MPAPADVAEYSKLVDTLRATNERIAKVQGQREQLERQLQELLAKNQVKSVAELEALAARVETEAATLAKEIEAYLQDVGQKLAALDSVTTQT